MIPPTSVIDKVEWSVSGGLEAAAGVRFAGFPDSSTGECGDLFYEVVVLGRMLAGEIEADRNGLLSKPQKGLYCSDIKPPAHHRSRRFFIPVPGKYWDLSLLPGWRQPGSRYPIDSFPVYPEPAGRQSVLQAWAVPIMWNRWGCRF